MLDGTPLLRFYGTRRRRTLARQSPTGSQTATLLSLVRTAAQTAFGRAHGFADISTVADFQARVPLRTYEAWWRDWFEPAFPVLTGVSWPGRIDYLAASSGTTSGTTKWIPVSHAMNMSNRKAVLDVLSWHLAARPDSLVFGGRSLVLGGSTGLVDRGHGVRSGDLSGIAASEVPWWARSRYEPPPDIALMSDWDAKLDAMARRAPALDIRSISGTPSWLLVLFDRLATLHPERPHRLAAWFPNLELLVHGGVAFGPYRDRFSAWLEGSRAETREVYPASEGFIAVADRGSGEGLRLLLDNGLFFEFVPRDALGTPDPPRHWVANAELGVDYALVLSSNAGLFAYVIGDTVRLVSRDPPRVLVTGRTSYMLSAFGEHVIGEELETAAIEAARAIGAGLVEFSVGAVMPQGVGELGRHLWVVETTESLSHADGVRFLHGVDATLHRLNEDYAAHRAGGVGMAAPALMLVPPGFFVDWMRRRGKLGGQNKVPRVVGDTLLADLRAAADAAGARWVEDGRVADAMALDPRK